METYKKKIKFRQYLISYNAPPNNSSTPKAKTLAQQGFQKNLVARRATQPNRFNSCKPLQMPFTIDL